MYKKATSRNLKEVVPFAQLPQGILISSVFQSDLLGYILRKNINDKQSFNVKSFYRPYDANLRSQVKVDFYKQGKCQGRIRRASYDSRALYRVDFYPDQAGQSEKMPQARRQAGSMLYDL